MFRSGSNSFAVRHWHRNAHAAVPQDRDSGRLRVAAIGLLLGNTSYALCPIHIPLMQLLARIVSATGSLATIPTFVGVSILAALAYHVWLERPALEFARQRGWASPALTQHARHAAALPTRRTRCRAAQDYHGPAERKSVTVGAKRGGAG